MNIKITIFLFVLIICCKTTENVIQIQENTTDSVVSNNKENQEAYKENSHQNQEEKTNPIKNIEIEPKQNSSTSYLDQDHQENISTLDQNLTEDTSIDNMNTTENTIKDLDKEIIYFYKNKNNIEEEEYNSDKRKFYEDKNYILLYKKNFIFENQSYEEFKISYKKSVEEKKQKKVEILNQIDPERRTFWRVDSNLLFDDVIYFQVSEYLQYKLCTIDEPYEFIFLKQIKTNKCINLKNIDINLLRNRNFFEEVSIFELISKKKGYYIIFQETRDQMTLLNLRDKNNQNHIVSFIETDGSDLLKIYLYNIAKQYNQNRIYFKIITPIDVLFRLSE